LLSNAYLNKHIQALYKFREFLLHTTNIIVAEPDIQREQTVTEEVQILTQQEVKTLYNATYLLHPDNTPELSDRDRAILTILLSSKK
jgi:integrase/recombinase XerD